MRDFIEELKVFAPLVVEIVVGLIAGVVILWVLLDYAVTTTEENVDRIEAIETAQAEIQRDLFESRFD